MRPGEIKYPNIFSPGKLGKIETKNKIKYASTETNFNTRDGFVTDAEVAYMEAQARGGSGIVTTQGAFTDPKGEGKGYVGMMGIYDDKFIPGLKRIADVIRKYDAKSVCQLMHCGRVGGVELDYTVGPSVVPQRIPRFREPREMTVEQIEICIREHIDGARRVVEAGFDSVEVSGIVGYLISNFNSKYTNKRTDEYGGSVQNRARFMTEILKGIRKEVGPDYPVIIRLCADELLDDRGGNTHDECVQIQKMAIEAGADILSVTAGWQESAVSVISRDCAMGSWLYLAKKIKDATGAPISMAYRLFLPEYPERAIEEGYLDFWEACRPMIADPDLPNKVAEDRQEDIIPCMACNLCLSRLFRDQPLTCMVRPQLGHEGDPAWQIAEAPQKKRVVVIGGGPAGMEAAAVAAERGHDVTLREKEERLGGQLRWAAKGPYGDEEFQRLIDYLETRCQKAGVKIECGKAVTPRDFSDPLHNPDVIVLATGADTDKPDAEGVDSEKVVSVADVMLGKVQCGSRVVILGGRGVGIAVAMFLVNEGGHEIAIVEKQKKIGRDVNPSYIWRYVKKLKQNKVQILSHSKVKEITAEGVVVTTPEGEETLAADHIVVATLGSQNELVEPLEFCCGELFTVGDAVTPRRTHNAMMEGFRTAMKI